MPVPPGGGIHPREVVPPLRPRPGQIRPACRFTAGPSFPQHRPPTLPRLWTFMSRFPNREGAMWLRCPGAEQGARWGRVFGPLRRGSRPLQRASSIVEAIHVSTPPSATADVLHGQRPRAWWNGVLQVAGWFARGAGQRKSPPRTRAAPSGRSIIGAHCSQPRRSVASGPRTHKGMGEHL